MKLDTAKTVYSTHLPGGQHWSLRVRRGTTMTFTAKAENTNVGLVFFNPENPLERLNIPDTLKCQKTFKLTLGNCLYSDMGRIFASITDDNLGWHDSIGGNLTKMHMLTKGWQSTNFQEARNERTKTGYDSFLTELTKYDLGQRDLPANLNLFSKVECDGEGTLHYVANHSKPGSTITLRFEMDTLVAMHTCPHPLDPSSKYSRRGVDIVLGEANTIMPNDVCYSHCPENIRGFNNNRLYYLGTRTEYFNCLEGGIKMQGQSVGDVANYSIVTPRQERFLITSSQRVENAVRRQLIEAGDHYIGLVKKGQTLRIVDVEGNEAADTLFYSAMNTTEHYSAMDTVREQGNLYLSTGTKLMSNSCNTMLTITADTCGRHDTLGGACASESNTVRYDLERRHMHSCRDNWMLAVSRHPEFGISKRDIAHNINFFMNVPVSPDGALDFANGLSGPGKYVEMVAAMDVVVLISNCPQLNNPCSGYAPTPLEVLVWD